MSTAGKLEAFTKAWVENREVDDDILYVMIQYCINNIEWHSLAESLWEDEEEQA